MASSRFTVVLILMWCLLSADDADAAKGKSKATGKAAAKQAPERKAPRGAGISAWGIVTLVVASILFFMGVYYFVICYPLMCAKERKYDVMEESSPV